MGCITRAKLNVQFKVAFAPFFFFFFKCTVTIQVFRDFLLSNDTNRTKLSSVQLEARR